MSKTVFYTTYRWLILICVGLSILSSAAAMLGFAPILSDIAVDLNVNIGYAANLMMAFVLANAFFLTWGGIVSDKYGITSALVLGLLCATVPAVLMPWIGHSFSIVFVSRIIQGASMGFIFAGIGPVLALWFPPSEHGLAGGLMIGSLSIGSALGVVLSPVLYYSLGQWQMTVAALSVPGWISIILALLFTRRKPPEQVPVPEAIPLQPAAVKSSFSEALSHPFTWIGTGIVFFNAWGLYGLYNLVPAYLATQQPVGVGLGNVVSGTLSLALTITGMFSMILGGIFFDKVAKGNYRLPIIIGFIMTGVATYLILLPGVYQVTPLLVLCLILAGWGVPFMNASLSAFIAMNYPPDVAGRMVGWWFGLGTFGGALGIYFGGKLIASSGSFYFAIVLIAAAAAVGLFLGFFLKQRRKIREAALV